MNKETQSRNIFKSNTVLSMFAKNEGYYAIFPADCQEIKSYISCDCRSLLLAK